MRNIIKLTITVLMAFVFLCSCDEDICGVYTFKSNTDNKISLFVYYSEGELRKPESIISLQRGEEYVMDNGYCAIGGPQHPYTPSIPNDSVILVFNDTVRVVLMSRITNMNVSIYGDSCLLDPISWRKTKTSNKGTMHYYEYEFTDRHYQKALEANGYAVD